MTQLKDKEPAFPCGSGDMRDPVGMSLRDYFAGQALVGLLSGVAHIRIPPDEYAKSAYLYADEMMQH